jgi:YfiH family protein
VDEPGQHAGARADAAVTATPGAVLAVHTADCAPLALVGAGGVVGAVHAGWRGLAGGVVEAAVARLRERQAGAVRAVVGPCIHPECYEFGPDELATLAARYGPEVEGRTSWGRPALDLPATVRAALARAGVSEIGLAPQCTACDLRFFSHRARGDTGRQAMLVWMDG